MSSSMNLGKQVLNQSQQMPTNTYEIFGRPSQNFKNSDIETYGSFREKKSNQLLPFQSGER